MKAILFPTYGSPDVLRLTEVDKPQLAGNEVLIKIIAAAANPLDWHRMRGAPFPARIGGGYLKPKDPRLGADSAGRVEAVGEGVTDFKPGDEVFGTVNGGFAEFTCTKAKNLARKPANISFEEAAAVPVAACTALQGLRYKGPIQAGQKVLINGASGGVGTFAVQIAKAYGAEVAGVCSTRNLDLVRSIGADHVIDYTREDFTRTGQHYDLIYDAICNRSVSDLLRALTPQGHGVVAGFTSMGRMIEHAVIGGMINKRVGLQPVASAPQADLNTLAEMLAAGKIKSIIDRRYPLSETADAIRYLETGRARGKVIITIG